MKSVLVVLLIGIFYAVGCAHDPATYGREDYDEGSQAAGQAYLVDAMHIRRPMPSRPKWKPLEFYYKHCSDNGEAPYYSKTSYECDDPY